MTDHDAPYRPAEEPQALARTQITERPELGHLADARIACVFAPAPLLLRGWPAAAFVSTPRVQGPLSPLMAYLVDALVGPALADPDFLILFDEAHWRGLEALRRDRLVYHELLHIREKTDEYGVPKIGQDGRLLLRLAPHDRELFDEELLRYGAATCGHPDLLGIVTEGELRAVGRPVHVVTRHE